MHKYIHNVTKVMCALYVRCALSVLQKECRKVWGARYASGARYRSENTVVYFNFNLYHPFDSNVYTRRIHPSFLILSFF